MLQYTVTWTRHDHHITVGVSGQRLTDVALRTGVPYEIIFALRQWCRAQFGPRGDRRGLWNYRGGPPSAEFVFRDAAFAFAFKTRWDGVVYP